MTAPLRLGIAGLGTVGIGVVKMVQTHGTMLATKADRPIEITAGDEFHFDYGDLGQFGLAFS